MKEWEHLADAVLPQKADPIFDDPDLAWASSYLLEEQTSRVLQPIGTFVASPDEIADLDGDVWEWTQDCYAETSVAAVARCPAYFVGGEHIAIMSFLVRGPAVGGCAAGTPLAHLGLRLVKEASTSR